MDKNKSPRFSINKKRVHRTISNTYKPNIVLYLLLLIVAISILLLAILIPIDSKWFAIISGVGCSGIASIIVAWLIDIINCNQKNSLNVSFIDKLFFDHDRIVELELAQIIEGVAKKNKSINLNKVYTLLEIESLLEAESDINDYSYYDIRYCNLGEACKQLDESIILSNGYTDLQIDIFTLIQSCKQNYKAFQEIVRNLPNGKEINTIAKSLLFTHLSFLEKIYEIRGNSIEIGLSQDAIRFVIAYRKAQQGEINDQL
ncbi:MAG: hypothetical protein IJS45_00040 [Clostridia bacterium]|nr:hypothetical protein [Clostridia bacterium]